MFEKSFGCQNLEKNEKASSNTNYRLDSVTKQFTATAILILIEQKKLNLSTNLCEIFNGFPWYGENISIYHLLTHTSGLIDYESLISDTATQQVYDTDVLQMMMQQDSTYFSPGTQYRYSNTGYALLTMIIEIISGKSFTEFLHENIFKPLGMNTTVAHREAVKFRIDVASFLASSASKWRKNKLRFWLAS